MKKTLKPFSIAVQPYLQDISDKEIAIKELANMAVVNGIHGTCYNYRTTALHADRGKLR